MQLLLWLPAHLAAWVMRLLAVLPLWVVGFPVVLVLALRRAWSFRPSPYFLNAEGDPKYVAAWLPTWARPWQNWEDGVLGNGKFTTERRGWPVWLRAFVWSAWRNPVNGARFVYPLGIAIEPRRIRVRANCPNSPQDDYTGERWRWSYVWQGLFAGLWIRTREFPDRLIVITWRRLWRVRVPVAIRLVPVRSYVNARIGWKLLPRDARGVPDVDYRSKGCGFGLQLQLRSE